MGRKKYSLWIIAIVAIVIVPIGMNYLIPIENNHFTIFGTKDNWFSFWSNYSGALISGLITLLVLYKTLKQNQDNFIEQKNHAEQLNREQKDFQLRILEKQRQQQWLEELKLKMIDDMEILNYSNIENMTDRISIVGSNIELINEITLLSKRIKGTKLSLRILYQDSFDSHESNQYRSAIEKIGQELIVILESFSSYLLMLEVSVVETQFRIGNVQKMRNNDLTDLAMTIENGYKDFSDKRKKIRDIIKNYKPLIDKTNEEMQSLMIELVRYEENKIGKTYSDLL